MCARGFRKPYIKQAVGGECDVRILTGETEVQTSMQSLVSTRLTKEVMKFLGPCSKEKAGEQQSAVTECSAVSEHSNDFDKTEVMANIQTYCPCIITEATEVNKLLQQLQL
jgi:hypothetical protein